MRPCHAERAYASRTPSEAQERRGGSCDGISGEKKVAAGECVDFRTGFHSAVPRAFVAKPQKFDCAQNDPFGVRAVAAKAQNVATSAYLFFLRCLNARSKVTVPEIISITPNSDESIVGSVRAARELPKNDPATPPSIMVNNVFISTFLCV